MRRLVLTESTASRIKSLINSGHIVLFTADYGCVDCEIFEDELAGEGLNWIIDYEVIVTHDDESIILAYEMGVNSIPQVEYNGKKITGNPHEMIETFKREFSELIEIYSNLKNLMQKHAEQLSGKINGKITIDMNILGKIAKITWKHGKPYCPCRISLGKTILCPCPHLYDDLTMKSKCLCGLFNLSH